MAGSKLRMYRARRLARNLRAATAGSDGGQLLDAIPIGGVLAVEGVNTGDGRRFAPGALTWDPELPVPLLWDRDDGDHTGVTVGHYDPATIRRDGQQIVADGQLGPTDDPDVAQLIGRVVELIRDGNVGQSVGVDAVDGHVEALATRDDDDDSWRHDELVDVTDAARLRHVALVDTPAFPEARPFLADVAGADRLYPAEHFARWQSDELVPFTIEPDGRVWGHAAGTGCHRSGRQDCLVYSGDVDPNMAGFHTGAPIRLDDGTTVRPGPLTFGGLHADVTMTRQQRRAFHEAGSTVVALVRAWDDHRGRLAVAGTLVDGLDDRTVDQLRGCSPSYERWPEGGGLTLLGLHMVPTPAHPVATAAAAGGPVVAVGCGCPDELRCERHAA